MVSEIPRSRKLFALTIFGYRKEGMDEADYHKYMSEVHANHLKALLAKNDIVSYTMQHNSSDLNQPFIRKAYGDHVAEANTSDCDAVVQLVFKDFEDYLRVRNDPHFINVVGPDHVNFADPKRTRFSMGWYEVHVGDGKVIS